MAAVADFEAFTCACRLAVTDPAALGPALAHVEELLGRVDAAASSFRPDSELSRLQRAGGGSVSPLLASLLRAALDAADRSGGAVVPTLGRELVDLGFGPPPEDTAAATGPRVSARPLPAESWRQVTLDAGVLAIPPGVRLDLGATAKAAAADRAAAEVHARFGTSVLVSLGGDLATAGDAAWEVLVQDLPVDPACQVSLAGGWAIATSSTQKRRRRAGTLVAHHILDPWTALPAPGVWRSVTVAAPDCVSANTASTAGIVRGTGAVAWLRGLGYPARLVRADRDVVELNGWPTDSADHRPALASGARR